MANARTDMHREDIKAAIRKTGITMNELSRRNGYSIVAVRITLRRRWPAVEAIVAKHLGLRPQDIWPSRYDELGEPLRAAHQTVAETSRGTARPHRQKREAA